LGCPSGDDYRRYEEFESIRCAVFVPVLKTGDIITSAGDYGKSPLYCKWKSDSFSGHIKSLCGSTSSATAGVGKRDDVYHGHFIKPL